MNTMKESRIISEPYLSKEHRARQSNDHPRNSVSAFKTIHQLHQEIANFEYVEVIVKIERSQNKKWDSII